MNLNCSIEEYNNTYKIQKQNIAELVKYERVQMYICTVLFSLKPI